MYTGAGRVTLKRDVEGHRSQWRWWGAGREQQPKPGALEAEGCSSQEHRECRPPPHLPISARASRPTLGACGQPPGL